MPIHTMKLFFALVILGKSRLSMPSPWRAIKAQVHDQKAWTHINKLAFNFKYEESLLRKEEINLV